MTIEVTYNVTDIYISSEVSPIYIDVNYQTSGGGAAVWGGITGTLSNQTDLQTALDAKVPYSGATGNVNLGEYEMKAGQVTLDTSPTGTAAVGTTRWNDTIGSSETTLKGGSVVLKNGVDLVARVVNKVLPNTTLTKAAYQAVRVSGAQGQRLAVAFAQANNDNNSADTIGLVIETIATNQEGFIITVGQIDGINTTGSLQGETWADGDVLYLSPSVAGALTNIKPTGATGHIVIVGYVEYAHANNGKIYVKVMNGWELDELHNVSITSVANNQGLFYNSSSSLWENKSISTVLGYTPEQPLTFSSPLSRLVNAVSIPAATSSVNGYLSSTDWSTFNSKQSALNGTGFVKVTGTTVSYDNSTYYLASNPSGYTSNLGTVTSVAALTLGTTGTDVSSTVATGTTTPVITLNIPTASATNRGALSSTDWSTFNSKQGALTLTTTGTSGAATLVGNTLNIPQYSGGGGMAIGGSITSATAGSVLFAGTSGVLAQNNTAFFWDNTNKRLGIGTNTPAAHLHILAPAVSTGGGRENLIRAFVSDSGTDQFGLSNATGNDTQFIPAFYGFSTGSYGQSVFRYLLTSAADTGTRALISFQTFITDNTTNPNDGNFSNSSVRPIFNVQNTTTTFLQLFATGNLSINSSTDAGFRLDVNGTARVQSALTVGTNALYVNTTNLRIGNRTSSPGAGLDLWNNGITENAQLRISDSRVSIPDYSATGFDPVLSTNTLGFFAPFSSSTGGLQFGGFTSNTNTGTPLAFIGYQGGTSPTSAAIRFIGYKHNGTTNRTALTGNEIIAGFSSGFAADVFQVKANGRINMSSLPTSSTGLSAGDLWNDAGTLKIV